MKNSAFVFVADGLGAGYLGTYGNGWLPTPTLNRIASQSLVVEFPWAHSLDVLSAYHGYFTGRHVLCRGLSSNAGLARACRDLGIATLLITDDPRMDALPDVAAFDEMELVTDELSSDPASHLAGTQAARFMAAVTDRIEHLRGPFLTWVHYAGLARHWDAPPDLRLSFADDDGPASYPHACPPEQHLAADEDPDLCLSFVQAYAAQVSVLDACLEMGLDALDRHAAEHSLLTLMTSSRGFALGEHNYVGLSPPRLHAESLHVPLMVRSPSGYRVPRRWASAAPPTSVFSTLAEWLGIDVDPQCRAMSLVSPPDPVPWLDRAVAVHEHEMSLRVPSWYLRQATTAQSPTGRKDVPEPSCQLYTKPDDRWEFNPIEARCPEIVSAMCQELDRFRLAAEHDRLHELPPLPELLW